MFHRFYYGSLAKWSHWYEVTRATAAAIRRHRSNLPRIVVWAETFNTHYQQCSEHDFRLYRVISPSVFRAMNELSYAINHLPPSVYSEHGYGETCSDTSS